MTEPITTALIVGLAAQKFAEGAAGKAAEKLIERLWEAIATRFKGRPKVEAAIGQIAAGPDTVAMTKLEKVLEGEFVEDEAFETALKAIVAQIQAAEPDRVQEMLVGIKTAQGIKGQDAKQVAAGPAAQKMLVDIEAGSIEFGNLTQEQ